MRPCFASTLFYFRKIERAFGMLVNRFLILKTAISFKPATVSQVILACAKLHNLCLMSFGASILWLGWSIQMFRLWIAMILLLTNKLNCLNFLILLFQHLTNHVGWNLLFNWRHIPNINWKKQKEPTLQNMWPCFASTLFYLCKELQLNVLSACSSIVSWFWWPL